MADTDPWGNRETVLADLELSRTLTIQMTAVGTLGFVVAFAVFSAAYRASTGTMPAFGFAPAGVVWWNLALDLLVLAVLGTLVLVPHEWVHGVAFRYFGGNPRYGVGLAYFVLPYAYLTTDHRFMRNQFVVLLSHLVMLTLVGVLTMVVFE